MYRSIKAGPRALPAKLTIIFDLMIKIQYPEPSFKVAYRKGQPFIFDVIRKKWLVLQDEEWVRQNFVHYLVEVLHYPVSLIALEKEIRLGELKKRFDILVYDPRHRPWMLVECKSEQVGLEETVLHQVLRYHIVLPARFLVITNGLTTLGWEKKAGALAPISAMPVFEK